MPLNKPQKALLFNNYYNYDTGEIKIDSKTDPLNVFMIAADAYYVFGKEPDSKSEFKAEYFPPPPPFSPIGDPIGLDAGAKSQLDVDNNLIPSMDFNTPNSKKGFKISDESKKLADPTKDTTDKKLLVLVGVTAKEYPPVLQAPELKDVPYQLFNTSIKKSNFAGIQSKSLGLFLKEAEKLSFKEKLEITIDLLKNNMEKVDNTIKFSKETIAVLDALYSNKTIDEKLSVPYVAGKDEPAAGQEEIDGSDDKQFSGGGGNFGASGFKANSFTDDKKDLKNQQKIDASKFFGSTGGAAGDPEVNPADV